MGTDVEQPYSAKILAYCAGVVVFVYWLPLIFLAVVDPNDDGRGGMVLCMSIPIVFVAISISLREMFRAIGHWRDSSLGFGVGALSLILFAATLSPLVVIVFGLVRNV
jgi:hypothetical protein